MDFMLEFYDELMKSGMTITQIDEMDIFWYFEILAHRAKKQQIEAAREIEEIL